MHLVSGGLNTSSCDSHVFWINNNVSDPDYLEMRSGAQLAGSAPSPLGITPPILAEATFDDTTTTGTVYANAGVGASGKPTIPTACGWLGHNLDSSIVLNADGGSTAGFPTAAGDVNEQSIDNESGDTPEAGEIIVLNKVESPVEQQLLRTYLNEKWTYLNLGANF
jgi:hypothetical protein